MKRRDFLTHTSTAALTAGLAPISAVVADLVAPGSPAGGPGWRISVQHWTYRRIPLFEALAMAAEVGLRCFEPRTILKLDANRPGVNADEMMPADARAELKTRAGDLGIAFPSVYADFTGDGDQARKVLEFWKSFGVEEVVCEPPPESIAVLEPIFAEFGLKLALHNHQRGKSAYWHPDIVREHTANRGEHLGACCDVGQWVRSNLDPIACLQTIGRDRMISFHLKDVLTKGDLESRNTVIGEGAAECASCLQTIHTLGYSALVTIDFEHDTPRLQDDMRKNIAFIRSQIARLAEP